MTDQLLEIAFEKAEKETGKDSANGRAEYISEYILTEFKYPISAKSLIRYYKRESTPGKETKDFLAQFLGYNNYESFVVEHSGNPEGGKRNMAKPKFYVPRKSLFAALLFIPIIGISAFIGYTSGEKTCMVWKEDQYIRTTCNGAELEREFIPYLYENFKKIKVTDTTTFFENGEVRI
ncbi:hypothetical protein LZ575_17670 [Antarcticibacterium sp. 1MA-6-2]|uniref:hypothetical protein n=1 Tax=Antarcticibacterium sp. 1MA-6-2 TaxID=2908210 RepID=UPI001F32C7CC|nr:hypothetical protein [Antarcticibacterium sp. 1MA-6-2]UJH90593.1 hypothetical protein LZ575_17670 [Antarcticibacterium sp. 1MA-6-2]